MGHDSLASNYLTIPVYVLGALGFFTFAFLSDKYGKCGVVSHSLTKPIIAPESLTSKAVLAYNEFHWGNWVCNSYRS